MPKQLRALLVVVTDAPDSGHKELENAVLVLNTISIEVPPGVRTVLNCEFRKANFIGSRSLLAQHLAEVTALCMISPSHHALGTRGRHPPLLTSSFPGQRPKVRFSKINQF